MIKYSLPKFLEGKISQKDYKHWLVRKAQCHFKRDKARENRTATNENYKLAIHKAVLSSKGIDAYTNEKLDWSLLNKYDNEDSKKNGRKYKKKFAQLPSVDHVGDGKGKAKFKICSWRTNDAKNDLSYKDFVCLCEKVVRACPKNT